MSEKISISEGNQGRAISSVDRLETELADGIGSCFWVPESERELESEYITENGDYESSKYAYSDISVNVMDKIGDFDVTIDDDLPIIDIDDIELTIDPDTGLPEITIGEEPIDLPDIDIDGDLDISIDPDTLDLDITGDLDGLDVDLNVDLDTLDLEMEVLPSEIRVITPPDQTEYQEGDRIHFEGLVVRAYDAQGNVWSDEDHPGGFIPLWELNFDPTIAVNKNKFKPGLVTVISENDSTDTWSGVTRHMEHRVTLQNSGVSLVFAENTHDKTLVLWVAKKEDSPAECLYKVYHIYGDVETESQRYVDFPDRLVHDGDRLIYGTGYLMGYYPDHWDNPGYKYTNTKLTIIGDIYIKPPMESWAEVLHQAVYENLTSVNVSWPRPKDNKILTASFDITVSESEASGDGSHHSGTF